MSLLKHAITWEGSVYRFASVDYAAKEDLATGLGAMKYAGRWNPKGIFPALYSSLTPETALAETRAHNDYYQLDFANGHPYGTDNVAREISLHSRSHRWKDPEDYQNFPKTTPTGGLATNESNEKGFFIPKPRQTDVRSAIRGYSGPFLR